MLKAGDCFCGADVGGRSSGTADSFKQLGTVCDPHKVKWPSACSCQAGARNRACPPFAHLIFGGAYWYSTLSVQGIFKQCYSVCIKIFKEVECDFFFKCDLMLFLIFLK